MNPRLPNAFPARCSDTASTRCRKNEAMELGLVAALNSLSPGRQWVAIGALVAVACGVILAAADPFAEAMVNTSRAIGLNEFLQV